MRTVTVLAALVITGCCDSPRPIAEVLPGSWKQVVSIYGEQRESTITFRKDGTFTEAVGQVLPRGFYAYPALAGKWSSHEDVITLQYSSGFEGSDGAQTEQRKVIKLTENRFISSDENFGIIVERERVNRARTGRQF